MAIIAAEDGCKPALEAADEMFRLADDVAPKHAAAAERLSDRPSVAPGVTPAAEAFDWDRATAAERDAWLERFVMGGDEPAWGYVGYHPEGDPYIAGGASGPGETCAEDRWGVEKESRPIRLTRSARGRSAEPPTLEYYASFGDGGEESLAWAREMVERNTLHGRHDSDWEPVPEYTTDPRDALAIVAEVLTWPAERQADFGRHLLFDAADGKWESDFVCSDVPRLLAVLSTDTALIGRAAYLALTSQQGASE